MCELKLREHDRAITCVFCCDLPLASLCPGLLQKKICLRESEGWRKRFSNKLVTRVTQGFTVFFPLPSFCVSSQMDGRKESCSQRSNIGARNAHNARSLSMAVGVLRTADGVGAFKGLISGS